MHTITPQATKCGYTLADIERIAAQITANADARRLQELRDRVRHQR